MKTMETDDVIAHQVPHIPKQHGSTVQSHHTTLDRVISRLEGKEYEHSYYNPFLENRVWKEKFKLKLCGFQSHLFIKMYLICHQQFSCV